jgi:DNA-binding NarL/FixJ family response regulator
MISPHGDVDPTIDRSPLVRLLLAETYPIVLEGMVKVLAAEPGFRVLATCADGDDALRLVHAHRPDVLMLDLEIPGDAMRVLREIASARLPTRVVLLSAQLAEHQIIDAIHLGAMGMVLKNAPLRTLVQCIRKVSSGQRWIETGSLGRLVDQLLRDEESSRVLGALLSVRELDVTRLAAKGWSNKEIGEKLAISEGTVKVHLHRVFEKLGVKSRLELALYVRDRGLSSALMLNSPPRSA